MRVGILGVSGRMGRQVLKLVLADEALTLAAAWSHAQSRSLGLDAGSLVGAPATGVLIDVPPSTTIDDLDVVIDFSTPSALNALLSVSGDFSLVSGTTGLASDDHMQLDAFSATHATMLAANFSTGVAVLHHLVATAANALPDFDVEIIEAHHRNKEDAPSGTALLLGSAVTNTRGQNHDSVAVHGRSGRPGPRKTGALGYHAVRGGGVVGEHQVWFMSQEERLELTHKAMDRATFAAGAIRAAKWIVEQGPGRHTFADCLGLTRT